MICARCEHHDKDHCKGGQVHSSPKEAQAMAGRGSSICIVRHCLHPLCSCVELVEGLES